MNLTSIFEDLRQLHLAVSGYAPIRGGRGSFNLYLRGHGAERFNVNQINDPDVRSFSQNRTLGATGDWRWARTTAGGVTGLRLGGSGTLNGTEIRIFAERIDPGLTTHVRSRPAAHLRGRAEARSVTPAVSPEAAAARHDPLAAATGLLPPRSSAADGGTRFCVVELNRRTP